MKLISVDENKCKADGICVTECPVNILRMHKKKNIPVPVIRAEQFCIRCGHCVSVCPHGALSHQFIPVDECVPVQDELAVLKSQSAQFLKSRRSIRTYLSQRVDKEIISELMDIAQYAPSGHNRQPVNWLVIHNPAEVEKLTQFVIDWMQSMIDQQSEVAKNYRFQAIVEAWQLGIDMVCRKAPHIILAHAPKQNSVASTACTIALTYLDLAVHSYKLGACWAGYFYMATGMWPPMQEALALPEGHVCHGAMLLGYPKFKFHRIPKRNKVNVDWK